MRFSSEPAAALLLAGFALCADPGAASGGRASPGTPASTTVAEAEADATTPAPTRAEGPSHETAHHGREQGKDLNRLAAAHQSEGDLVEARRLYAEALAVLEPVTQAGDAERDLALEGLGDVAYTLRDYATSSRVRRRLLDERLAVQGENGVAVGSALHRLAKTEGAMGNLETASELADRALATLEHALGPDAVEVGYVLVSAAVLARRCGDYVKARRLIERALANIEHSLGPEHPHVAGTLNNLGRVLEKMGDLEAARRAHERALAIREAALGPGSPAVAQSLSNLGAIAIREERPESAVPLLERALAIRERAMDENSPAIGLTLINLGLALAESGELEPARRALGRSIAIFAQHPSDAAALADAVTNLGMVELALGRPAEATATLGRARTMAEAIRGHEHPKTEVVMYNEARAAAARGDVDFALGLALEAERVSREHLQLTAAGLSEREALVFAAQQRDALDAALSLVTDKRIDDPVLLAATWDALIRSRGLVLEEMVRRRSPAAGSSAVDSLIAARRSAAGRLSRLLLDDRQSGSADDILAARHEIERAERLLGEASPLFAQNLALTRLGWTEVAAGLPQDACLVAFTRFNRFQGDDFAWRGRGTEPCYLAMTFDHDHGVSAHAIGSAAPVDDLARRWRAAASRPVGAEAEALRTGELLRQTLWDPVTTACGDARRVFVVPDGELALLNLAALPAASGGFLIERGPLLAVLGTERDLVPDPFEPKAGPCLLAIGEPDFDVANGEPSDRRDQPGGDSEEVPAATAGPLLGRRFPQLPGTAAEAAHAAELWSGAGPGFAAVQLTGDEATESAFTTLAPGFRVLHLATHGFFFDGDPGPTGAGGRGVGGLVAEAPMGAEPVPGGLVPVAGLVLAGANRQVKDAADDGILTAGEIATLDLSGVEWAVLSACESGVGEASAGEGVFGLRRAFRMAGARTVIMSLWPVDDEAAREWMTALYQARLGDGLSTAEAVRRASLEVLAARRARGDSLHPAHWAAFVAAGDWR